MEEKKPLKIKFKTAVIIIVTAVVLLGIGANVYASVNGYGNIFFLIKYLVTGEKTEIIGKDELLSDRDITISYEPITLTKDIKLQIRNLQIKNNKANLILAVSENNKNDVTPLKYKVYNSQNKVICEQNSTKSGDITQYTEELKLNEFNNDKIIYLEVDNSKNEKITKISINLETREISVEDEKEAVEKISEIKLKDFLGYVSAFEPNKDSIDEKILFSKAMLKKYDYGESESRYLEIVNLMLESCGYEKIPNSFEPTEYFKPGKYYTVDTIEVVKARGGFEPNKVLEIKDISYCGGIYTVKFNYAFIKEDGTDVNYNDLNIKEATVEFELNTNKDYSEFKVVKFTQETENEENTDTEISEIGVYAVTANRFSRLSKIYMNTNNAFELGEYTNKGWKVLNHDEVINNLFTEIMKKIYQNRLPDLLQIVNNQAYVGEGGGFYSYDSLGTIDIINYTDNTINVNLTLKYLNTNFEFFKNQNAEMKLVKQDGKWLIDSFDVTKFYDIPDGAVVEENQNHSSGSIIIHLTPSGFSGSSLHRVELDSNKEVYVKTFDGNGYTDNNVTSRELIAKNVESISKNNEGSIIIKGGEKVKDTFNWIIFEQENNNKTDYRKYIGEWVNDNNSKSWNSGIGSSFCIKKIENDSIIFNWNLWRVAIIEDSIVPFKDNKAVFYYYGNKYASDELYCRKATIELKENKISIHIEDTTREEANSNFSIDGKDTDWNRIELGQYDYVLN